MDTHHTPSRPSIASLAQLSFDAGGDQEAVMTGVAVAADGSTQVHLALSRQERLAIALLMAANDTAHPAHPFIS
jgi:hypothetical protein